MKYINALKGSLIALCGFGVIVNFIPNSAYESEIKSILTVSTFIFATLSGFLMSRLHKRYNSIRYLTAAEDSEWISIYMQSKLLSKNISKQYAELIDEYLIIALDYDLGEYYKYNAHIYSKAYDILNDAKLTNHKNIAVHEVMLKTLRKIEYYRNYTSVLYREKVNGGQWAILILLASIITFCLFVLTSSASIVKMVTVLLASSLVMILLLMRDLYNLKLEDAIPLLESAQEVFETIGKPRYYHSSYFSLNQVKKPKGSIIRIGIHVVGEKIKIKKINV